MPATSKPIPAPNSTINIEPTPAPQENRAQPPTPRYRHIMGIANGQLRFCAHRPPGSYGEVGVRFQFGGRGPLSFPRCNPMLRRIRRITPQLPITWKRNLRYMKAGEEAHKRHSLSQGTPGYQ